MTRILIVRHGQSVWNAAGRWQGQADPPLTDLGRRQATLAERALPAVDVLAASTLQRAHQTALLMAEARGIDDVPLDARFMERDAGAFSGLTRPEIEERFPGYLAEGRWPDGWEDDVDLVARVRAGLDALVAETGGPDTMAVVSHGGVVYALEGSLGAPHQSMSNLEGRWFTWTAGDLALGDRVHLLDAADETTPTQI